MEEEIFTVDRGDWSEARKEREWLDAEAEHREEMGDDDAAEDLRKMKRWDK